MENLAAFENLHASYQIQSNQVETVCEILGHKLVWQDWQHSLINLKKSNIFLGESEVTCNFEKQSKMANVSLASSYLWAVYY